MWTRVAFNWFRIVILKLIVVFRAVAVVVDPIQSVKGKVVIDAFRLINPNMMVCTINYARVYLMMVSIEN